MQRYRVLTVDFDARAQTLLIEIQENWEPKVKELWQQNKEMVRTWIRDQYGSESFEQKVTDFCDLGSAPFSVVAFHNRFFTQARNAFVIGAYYPALTAACALGERILNHMILMFRSDFQATPEYKQVYHKKSFENWHVAIETLVAWQLILPATADKFRELGKIRNRNIHFKPETDTHARQEALSAMRALHDIIDLQFAALGVQPWYIPNAYGMSFIRKSFETDPFVRRILLPCCKLVGPAHKLQRRSDGQWVVEDQDSYPSTELSDEDFIAQFKRD
jgi:hypothetical protein